VTSSPIRAIVVVVPVAMVRTQPNIIRVMVIALLIAQVIILLPFGMEHLHYIITIIVIYGMGDGLEHF